MEHKLIKSKEYCFAGSRFHTPADMVTFESAEDIYEYIKDSPTDMVSHQEVESGFNLHEWPDVLDMLHTGYSEGAAELDATLETLTKGIGEQDRDVWNMDVSGDFIDIGEYMTGSPECFMKQETIKEFGELVKIRVNVTFLAGVTTTTILNRGAVAMALVDAISKTNPVELEIILCSKSASTHSPSHLIDVRYKTTMEGGYSRDLVAFMLTHPDYMRRCGFAVRELIYPNGVAMGYGSSTDLSKQEQAEGIYFPCLHDNRDYKTMGKAIEKFKELLAPYVSDTAALG